MKCVEKVNSEGEASNANVDGSHHTIGFGNGQENDIQSNGDI